MKTINPTPEKIMQQLASSASFVVDGIQVEATIDEAKLVFRYRLDAFSRPSKQQAVALLAKLNAYYTELHNTSEQFRTFIGSRQFTAELYVFSGHMDFSVATMDQNGVQWHVNLNE
ncbi:MAG: hypothetical protein CL608_05665 [Anaerolineaceae bacterium]|nr:hypothetical protein [Anaerolineaceae bacterium]